MEDVQFSMARKVTRARKGANNELISNELNWPISDRGEGIKLLNEVCLTLLHMTSTGNETQDLLILSPMLYPLGHILPYPTTQRTYHILYSQQNVI